MEAKFFIILAALIVTARAGGPAAYSISAPSVDAHSVGSSNEHTVKGHYGASSHSEYHSSAETPHSHATVSRTSITNDAHVGHAVAAAPVYAHAAPAYAHAAPVYAHTAPAVVHHAPAVHAVHAPAVVAAPAYHGFGGHYGGGHYGGHYGGHLAVAAPAVKVAAAPAVAYHGGSYLGHGLGHGVAYGHAGLGYGHGLALGHGYGLGHGVAYGHAGHYAAPAYAYGGHYAAAPVVKAVAHAPLAIAHTAVAAHGHHIHY